MFAHKFCKNLNKICTEQQISVNAQPPLLWQVCEALAQEIAELKELLELDNLVRSCIPFPLLDSSEVSLRTSLLLQRFSHPPWKTRILSAGKEPVYGEAGYDKQ